MTTEIATTEEKNLSVAVQKFEYFQRRAGSLTKSGLTPPAFKEIANALIAVELAHRMGLEPIFVAQNLNIIHGRPSWSSQFIIAQINGSGRFSEPLQYRTTGTGDEKTCIAWTVSKKGEVVEGPPVSIAMAKKEGWYQKTGSKWQSMPDLMLTYRAATFFGRVHCPDLLMGIKADDEVRDVVDVKSEVAPAVDALNAKIKAKKTEPAPMAPALEPEVLAPEDAADPSDEQI